MYYARVKSQNSIKTPFSLLVWKYETFKKMHFCTDLNEFRKKKGRPQLGKVVGRMDILCARCEDGCSTSPRRSSSDVDVFTQRPLASTTLWVRRRRSRWSLPSSSSWYSSGSSSSRCCCFSLDFKRLVAIVHVAPVVVAEQPLEIRSWRKRTEERWRSVRRGWV